MDPLCDATTQMFERDVFYYDSRAAHHVQGALLVWVVVYAAMRFYKSQRGISSYRLDIVYSIF